MGRKRLFGRFGPAVLLVAGVVSLVWGAVAERGGLAVAGVIGLLGVVVAFGLPRLLRVGERDETES
ncbi:hypothetical protein [Tepidiforma sp.]|uniref:hypothetical protein n=1 Tax=Tepidiforma sp. TaxID=2682230 RepID=UPI002ADD453D|nr:hypothetical protein [Tepidiforma sp.]